MNFLKLKNKLLSNTDLEWMNCFKWKYSRKARKLSKNGKFVTNKTKICLFCHCFIFFMRLRLGFQLVVVIYDILSENLLNGTTNLIQQRKRSKSHIPQSYSEF